MFGSIDKTKVRKELVQLGIILGCGILNGIMMCPSCMNEPKKMASYIGVSCIFWFVMWKGNALTSKLVSKYYSWLKEPVERLIYGILGHTLYTSLAVVGIFYGLEFAFNIVLANMKYTLIFSIIIALVISTIFHSREFLFSWRNMAIESEKVKKEAMISKYESLKNQVNPHFLFNSLNALTNLVYEDQDKAAKFIKKLSDVYRYVLESRDKDLVVLSEEMKFVQSYLFLQNIRYEKSLNATIDLSDMDSYNILPLSVQMLLENSIKHNIISEDEPLKIQVYQEAGYLMVVNNLQKKKVIKSDSSEMGLSNIKARYSFFTDKPVTVSDQNGKFIVGLPLLKLS